MHTFASGKLRQGNRKKENRNWKSETSNDGLALKDRSPKSETVKGGKEIGKSKLETAD